MKKSIASNPKTHLHLCILLVHVCTLSLVSGKVKFNNMPGLGMADSLGSVIGSRFHFQVNWSFNTVQSYDQFTMCHVTLRYSTKKSFFLVKGKDTHRGQKLAKGDLVYFVDPDKPVFLVDLRISRFPDSEEEARLLSFCEMDFNSKDLDEILGVMDRNWDLFQIQPPAEVGTNLNVLKMTRLVDDETDFEWVDKYSEAKWDLLDKLMNKIYSFDFRPSDDEQVGGLLKREIATRLRSFKQGPLKKMVRMFKEDLQKDAANTGTNLKLSLDEDDEKRLKFAEKLDKVFDTLMTEFNPEILQEENIEYLEYLFRVLPLNFFDALKVEITKPEVEKPLNYDLLFELIENNHVDSRIKPLKLENLSQYLKSAMGKMLKKAIKKTLIRFFEAREGSHQMAFLGDEIMERVIKKFSRVMNEDFALDQMDDILYWVGEEAGMTIEKVLFLIGHEVRSRFNVNLLVDLFYGFCENSFMGFLDEMTFFATLIKKYGEMGILQKREGERVLDIPKLIKLLSIWRDFEDDRFTYDVVLPFFVRSTEDSEEETIDT